MRAYLDRTVDPPRLPTDNALLERMRQARGKRVAQLVEETAIDPSAVLAYEIHIEPDHFNDTSPEWLYELTTPLGEAYRAGDAEAVQALLAQDAQPFGGWLRREVRAQLGGSPAARSRSTSAQRASRSRLRPSQPGTTCVPSEAVSAIA